MSDNPWATSGPSIFSRTDGNESVNLGGGVLRHYAKPTVNPDKRPRVTLAGQDEFDYSGVDWKQVYDYRKSGKAWAECAQKFGGSYARMRANALERFPDLADVGVSNRRAHRNTAAAKAKALLAAPKQSSFTVPITTRKQADRTKRIGGNR